MEQTLQKRRTSNHPATEVYTSVSLSDENTSAQDLGSLTSNSDGENNIRPNDLFLKPSLSSNSENHIFIRLSSKNKYLEFYYRNKQRCILALLTFLSAVTRYYRIGRSNRPVWDEVHFGKFGSHYLRGTFYHDVHPPLGKMLVGLAGRLAGYDGTFKFDGGDYPATFNYTVMRVFHATFGITLVPLAYLTAQKLRFPLRSCLLAAGLVLMDNGLTVISRFILLDSMLITFIALSLYFLAHFHSLRDSPFTDEWWLVLLCLGASLGLASSVKWIGLFMVALVGLYTIEDLWEKFGDLRMPKNTYIRHWFSRIIGLIVVPMVIYVFCFKLHFLLLPNSGPGDGTMDTLFQARLDRSNLLDSPPDTVYMANVTIRSGSLDGSLLHSHEHIYPSGSNQQQITCYNYKDNNNDWTILPESLELEKSNITLNAVTDSQSDYIPNPPKVVDRSLIRLRHVSTGKNLRVQPEFDAIITGTRAFEVSAGGRDENIEHELWRVELYDDLLLSELPLAIQTLSSRFRLRNPTTGCLLASGDKKYPDWGFGQQEVFCVKDTKSTDEETLWNIESLQFSGIPSGPRRHIPSKFFRDFIRIHRAMWSTNNALVADEEKFDHLTSQAWEWPFMRKGIRMCGWGDTEIKYYMLSNPLVVWGTSLALLTYFGLLINYLIKMKRQVREWTRKDWEQFTVVGKFLAGGWFLQYIPFFLMGRVLYVHHYFPALYFACILAPFVLEHIMTKFKLSSPVKDRITLLVGIIVLSTYLFFGAMTFGMDYPSIEFSRHRSWLSTWRFSGPENP